MLDRKRMAVYRVRRAIVGAAILCLLAATPLAAVAGDEGLGRYSGDDPYDPAAGGTPELSVVMTSERPVFRSVFRYSGDDPYDPAAGGTPELSVVAFVADVSPPVDCVPSADELNRRAAMRVAGGYSGDDPYDPAAGGTPELSLLAFADASGRMLACVPAISNY